MTKVTVVGFKLFACVLCLCSASVGFSESVNWPVSYSADGCGQSEREARMHAHQNAKSYGAKLKNRCDHEGGDFQLKLRSPYCLPYEPSNLSCPAHCMVTATASCIF